MTDLLDLMKPNAPAPRRGSMKDMLGDTPCPYPQGPGYRDQETSREAAAKIAPEVTGLRAKAIAALRAHPDGLTPHEVARLLGRSVPSVQPRLSELVGMGLVDKTKERRTNESGMTAAVHKVRAA